MTLQELKDKLRSAGFHVIHVEDDVAEDEAKGLSFHGGFEEYIDSLKALEKKVVFLATHELEKEGFDYTNRNGLYNNDDELEIEIEEIDLCLVNSDIEGMKSYIGEIGVYKLFTSMSEDSLNFYFYEDWWLEYIQIWIEAVSDFKAKKAEILEKMEKAEKEKEKDILKAVRQLAKDNSFCGLKRNGQ